MLQPVLDFLSRPEVMVVGLGLALFLALSWVIRGAPFGQAAAPEPVEAPSKGRRDRAASLAVAGFLAILGAGYLAIRVGILASIPAFVAGFGLILWVQSTTRPYRHVSPSLRRVDEFSRTALGVALLGGILVVANVFAFKYGGRAIDFTRDEAFTLSTQSVNVAEGLKVPLRLTLVFGRDRRSQRHQGLVDHLARLYRAENPSKVSIEFADRNDPARADEFNALLKRVPDLAVVPGDAIVLEYGETPDVRSSVIELRNLFKEAVSRDSGGSVATEFSGEDAITSALIRFREGKRVQVGFTSGHGEPSLDEFGPQASAGLGLWRARLGSYGIEAIDLNLSAADVPDSVAAVVVVAPRKAFAKVEADRLTAYLARGPILFVMGGQVDSGLDEILAKFNMTFEPGLIHDDQRNSGNRGLVVTLPIRRGESALSDSLAGQMNLTPTPSALTILGAPRGGRPPSRFQANPGVIVAPFLRTSQTSRLSGGPDPRLESAGPFNVGAAASERGDAASGLKPKPRAVLLASGELATNPYFAFNADLLMNSIQWLRGRTESAGVSAKVHNSMLFVADPNLQFRLHAIPTIVAFVLIVGLGVTTYLARRS